MSNIDIRMLFILEKHERMYGRLSQAHERTQRRLNHLNRIRNWSEAGQIAVVWSGRDCDGVRYSGNVYLVEATVADVDEHINHTYAWADGPCSFYLERPSVARGIEATSRDLTLEAFEDGHQHVIYD